MLSYSLYVVNRRSRSDRRKRIAAALARAGLEAIFTSDWDGPYDWLTIGPSDLANLTCFPWEIDHDNPWWSRPLKLGEIACSLAHDACWRHFLEERHGRQCAVILEDDALFETDLLSSVGQLVDDLQEADWDFCYLGRVPLATDRAWRDRVVKPGYSHCTYGYVISRSGAAKLVQADIRHSMMPIDEFIPALYMSHPRPDVSLAIEPRLDAFAASPSIVSQLPKVEAGSDTEDSPFLTQSAQ